MKTVFNEVATKDLHSHNSNPWGLVYADALTENVPGKVNIHSITYDLNGLKIGRQCLYACGLRPGKELSGPCGGTSQRRRERTGCRAL